MMKRVFELVENQAPDNIPQLVVKLPFDDRKKSRLKTKTVCGEELGFMLPRGQILRGGTLLKDEAGRIIQVLAAEEAVSIVETERPHLLLRAAYHLGNRHVPLQIDQAQLLYQHDHVLDEMVKGLGLSVSSQTLPFEPEDGAYTHSAGHNSGSHHHEH